MIHYLISLLKRSWALGYAVHKKDTFITVIHFDYGIENTFVSFEEWDQWLTLEEQKLRTLQEAQQKPAPKNLQLINPNEKVSVFPDCPHCQHNNMEYITNIYYEYDRMPSNCENCGLLLRAIYG